MAAELTVNECARDSGLKSANNTGSMRFASVVHDHRRRLNQSPFRPRAEVSFPCARQFIEYNGKETSASREILYEGLVGVQMSFGQLKCHPFVSCQLNFGPFVSCRLSGC